VGPGLGGTGALEENGGVSRPQLSDADWEFISPFLPVGEYGPYPENLRAHFEGGGVSNHRQTRYRGPVDRWQIIQFTAPATGPVGKQLHRYGVRSRSSEGVSSGKNAPLVSRQAPVLEIHPHRQQIRADRPHRCAVHPWQGPETGARVVLGQ